MVNKLTSCPTCTQVNSRKWKGKEKQLKLKGIILVIILVSIENNNTLEKAQHL